MKRKNIKLTQTYGRKTDEHFLRNGLAVAAARSNSMLPIHTDTKQDYLCRYKHSEKMPFVNRAAQ